MKITVKVLGKMFRLIYEPRPWGYFVTSPEERGLLAVVVKGEYPDTRRIKGILKDLALARYLG